MALFRKLTISGIVLWISGKLRNVCKRKLSQTKMHNGRGASSWLNIAPMGITQRS